MPLLAPAAPAADLLLPPPRLPQAFIDRFRYNANRAALVQSRIKALERMAEVQVGGAVAAVPGCML